MSNLYPLPPTWYLTHSPNIRTLVPKVAAFIQAIGVSSGADYYLDTSRRTWRYGFKLSVPCWYRHPTYPLSDRAMAALRQVVG